jgi:GTP-binding protein Era
VAELVKLSPGRLIVAINKVDLLKDKTRLLPHLQKLQEIFPDTDLVPISAESGDNTKRLEQLIAGYLPESPFYFEEDQVTDRTERFMVSEIIREKMMRQLGEELPYALTIQIEQFKDEGKLVRIEAVVFVEREGQKIILIGKGGSRLKRIGTDARKDIERLLGRKVMLNVWAKVKSGWSDSDRAIKSLGYDDV